MEDLEVDSFSRESTDKSYIRYAKPGTLNNQNIIIGLEPYNEPQEEVIPKTSVKDLLPSQLKDEPAISNSPFAKDDGSWETMYQEFKDYVEKNGHTNPSADQDLRDWLNRQILNQSRLPESQFKKLDILGVNWDTPISRDHAWELMFTRLKAFSKTFGHCRVPNRWAEDKQLALWVTAQRRVYLQNKIREDRKRLLDEAGFIWQAQELYNNQWEDFFEQLLAFQNEHGHCNVPHKQEKLVSWIERQRLARKKGLLLPEREAQLNDIGFIWSFTEIKKKSWEERYRQLHAFNKMHGHSFVPVNYKGNKQLGNWVGAQRRLEAAGKLPASKKKKLDKLSFVWSSDTQNRLKQDYDSQWENNFEKLKAYRQLHGTCQVSLKTDPLLQSWTSWQRKMFYEGRLSSERIDMLNEIYFPWSVQEGYWMKMYNALLSFNEQFGHSKVPHLWEPNPKLAAWTYRIKFNKHKLCQQKIDLLNAVGFDWELKHKIKIEWPFMYRRLLSFKQEHGHTRVPVRWYKDPRLGKWVSRMRNEKEKLSPGRLSLLEAIEFDWGQRITRSELNV